MREIVPSQAKVLQDPSWVDRTNKQIKAESDRLEMELKGYKNNLIKESIRVWHGILQSESKLIRLL